MDLKRLGFTDLKACYEMCDLVPNNEIFSRHEVLKANIEKEFERRCKAILDKKPEKEPSPEKSSSLSVFEFAESVISYFNLVKDNYDSKGRQLKLTPSRQKTILARVKDGASYQELCSVIKSRFIFWYNQEEMRQYLTPETLFRQANFQKYLEQSDQIINKHENKSWTETKKDTGSKTTELDWK